MWAREAIHPTAKAWIKLGHQHHSGPKNEICVCSEYEQEQLTIQISVFFSPLAVRLNEFVHVRLRADCKVYNISHGIKDAVFLKELRIPGITTSCTFFNTFKTDANRIMSNCFYGNIRNGLKSIKL